MTSTSPSFLRSILDSSFSFKSSKSNIIIYPNFSTIIQDSVYNRLGSFGYLHKNRNELNNIRNTSNNNVQEIENFKNKWFQNHTNID